MTGPDTEAVGRIPRRALLLFVAATFVLQFAVWNGRLGNSDTYDQLVATVHAVDTGRLGINDAGFAERIDAIGSSDGAWTVGAGGRWYQVHDPGNKILMAPAVVAARLVGRQPSGDLAPSTTTKMLAAGSITAFGALLPLFLALALALILPAPRALRWALLGVVATILLPYAKQTWDVFPCAVMVAALAWLSLRRLTVDDRAWRWPLALFAAAGVASCFRFSLAAFLLLGCFLVELLTGRDRPGQRTWLNLLVGTAAFFVAALPVFVANHLSTGAFWKPPLAGGEDNHLFSYSPVTGVAGVLVGPSRGLVWFSPVFLLLLAIAWEWRRFARPVRTYVLAWLVPLGGYVFALGSIRNWGPFGWGPRTLVPIVPLLWVPVAVVGARWIDASATTRRIVVAVVGLSIALAVLPTLTNWNAATSLDLSTIDTGLLYPRQIVETARYVGRHIPGIEDYDGAVDSHRWPDLAILYATRRAGVPDVLGWTVFALLLVGVGALLRAADRAAQPARVTPSATAAAATAGATRATTLRSNTGGTTNVGDS